MDDLQFLLSFNIQTSKTIKQAEDVFTGIRNLASQAVILNLEANPNFQKVKNELKSLQEQMKQVEDSSDSIAQKQEQLAQQVVTAARRINGAVRGAGDAIKEAFDKGGIEAATREAERFRTELSKVASPRHSRVRQDFVEQNRRIQEARSAGVDVDRVARQVIRGERIDYRISRLERFLARAPANHPRRAERREQLIDLQDEQVLSNQVRERLEAEYGDLVGSIRRLAQLKRRISRAARNNPGGGARNIISSVVQSDVRDPDAVAQALGIGGRYFDRYSGDLLQSMRSMQDLPSAQGIRNQMAPLVQQLSRMMIETAAKTAGAALGNGALPGVVAGIPGLNVSALQAEVGGLPALPLKADHGILTESINTILREFEKSPAALLKLTGDFAGMTGVLGTANAQREMAAAEASVLSALGGSVGSVADATRRDKRGRLTDAEKEVRSAARKYVRLAEERARGAEATDMPLEILAGHGVNADLLTQFEKARGGTVEQAREALKGLQQVTQQYADAVKGAENNGTADLLNKAFRRFQSLFVFPLDRLSREAERRENFKAAFGADKENARQQYMRDLAKRIASQQSSFSGLYQDLGHFPLDPYKASLEQYRKTFQDVLRYERELTGYTLARNDEERKIADTRINAARRAVELSQTELDKRLLFNRTLDGSKTVNTRDLETRFRLDAGGRLGAFSTFSVSNGEFRRSEKLLSDAYRQTAALLQQEFGPGIEALNQAQRELQISLLDEARALEMAGDAEGANRLYGRANGLRELGLQGFIAKAQAGDPEVLKHLANTLNLSPVDQAGLSGRSAAEQDEIRLRLAQERVSLLGEEIRNYGKLVQEIRSARQETEVLSRYDRLVAHRQSDPFGYRRAAYGLSHSFGGYALGYGAGFAVMNAFRQYSQYDQEIKNIQGVLSSRSPMDAQAISRSIGITASRYGADLMQTAEAAKVLAQAGLNAREVMSELDHTMQGMRAMGMTIEQMQELQVAVREVSDEADRANASLSVLEKISSVERSTAVSAQQLAEALKISSPFLKQFSEDMRGLPDVFDTTIGATTVMVEQLRISGSQAGRSLNMIMSRMLRPETQKRLQDEFGLKLGQEGGNAYLPLNEMLDEIHRRYQELQNSGQRSKAQELLVEVAGARQVAPLSALLNNYQKYLDITTNSTYAFGDANERTGIALDSMAARVQRVKTNFQLLFNKLGDGTLIADGLKTSMSGLATLMGGATGTGLGTTGSLLTIAGGFAAFKGARVGMNEFGIMRDSLSMPGVSYAMLRADIRRRRLAEVAALAAPTGAVAERGVLSTVGGRLAATFGPTGTIVLGLTSALVLVGAIDRIWKHFHEQTNEFAIRLKSLEELKIFDSPQFQQLSEMATNLGPAGMTAQTLGVNAQAAMDPRKNPALAAILAKYGANDFQQLLAMTQQGGMNRPQIAKEILAAFTGSSELGAVGERLRTARDATEAQEHLVEATKLMGLAAWEAVFRINQALEALQDSTNRMISNMESGLQVLDTRNRDNLFTALYQGFLDQFLDRATLQRRAFGSDVGSIPGVGGNETRMLPRSDFEAARENVINLLSSSGLNEGLVGVLEWSTEFKDALREATDGLKGLNPTVAGVVAKMGEILTKDTALTTSRMEFTTDEKGNIVRAPRDLTRQQAIEFDLAQRMLGLSEIQNATKGINADYLSDTSVPAADRALTYLRETFRNAQNKAQEQARLQVMQGHPDNFNLKALSDLSNAMEHNFLTMELGTDTVWAFQKQLTSLMLEFYKNTEKLKEEERFASAHGLAFNAPQQRFELLKNTIQDLNTFQSGALAHILELQAEKQQLDKGVVTRAMKNAAGGIDYVDVDTNLPGTRAEDLQELQKRRSKVSLEITNAEEELNRIRQGLLNAANLFPAGQARDAYLRALQAAFPGAGVVNAPLVSGLSGNLESQLPELQRQMLLRKLSTQESAQQLSYEEKLVEVSRSQIDHLFTLTQRQALRERLEGQLLAARIADLAAQRDQQEISEEEYQLKVQQAKVETAVNLLYERRMAVQSAINDLSAQSKQNLESMVQGLSQSLSNLDLWKPLADSLHGNGSVTFGRALTDVVGGVIGPVADTLRSRLAENFTADLVETLGQTKFGAAVGALPENRMKAKILEAVELAKEPLSSGLTAGAREGGMLLSDALNGVFPMMRDQIVQGFLDGATGAKVVLSGGSASDLESKIGSYVPNVVGGGIVSPSIIRSVSGGSSTKKGSTAENKKLAQQLVVLAAGIAGDVVGGGGRFAGIGSSLGSVLGNFLFPGPVGTSLGGLLGGFIGGRFDSKGQQTPQLSALQAIERVEREQLSAIERQTDALLHPENRYLNLPSNFTVPGYLPQFAGSGGGAYAPVAVHTYSIQIDARGSTLSESAIESATVKGLSKALNTSMITRSRRLPLRG